MRRAGLVGLAGVLAVAALGCGRHATLGEVPAASVDGAAQVRADDARPGQVGPIIVAHGGQGSPASRSQGPARAAEQGYAGLLGHDDAVAAAIATLEVLEDDPMFNAGTGANLRVDGRSIEADAAIMSDGGPHRFGAVAGIAGVRHPIRVAEAVRGSPHLLLAGEGAQLFAATLDLEPRALVTEQARAKLRRGYARLFDPSRDPWAGFDWRRHWNFPTPAPATLDQALADLEGSTGEAARAVEPDETQDTVGVVVRTASGRYAAALSTGGTTLALHGRVGDVPVLGAGLYAGPHGAVAATGKGEAIIRERVAARVYDLLAAGATPNDAITRVMRGVSEAEGVGVIAVSERGWGTGASSQMAWAVREGDASYRADTWIQHSDR